MGIQRVLEYAWRDTTHMEICDFLSSADETHIYNRIQGLIGNRHPGRMTSLGFFRRISKIFGRKYTKQLPQDLVHEIVSRLSAEDVLKCIMVCEGWMGVILNPHFFDLHESRARPLILLQNIDQTNATKLWSLDLTHEKPYIRRFDTTKLTANVKYYFLGTVDGLLVLQTQLGFSRRSSLLSICNPLTGRVIKGVTIDGDRCLGFWFHPFKREYLFLTTCSSQLYTTRGCCYKIFNLKGESTVVGWYRARPIYDVPIIIGNSFYYLCKENRIMSFDTETEEFDLKLHPHYTGCKGQEMRLLEIEGSLAFSHVCEGMKSLFLWTIVDHATWQWSQRYKINLNWCHDFQFGLRPLCIQNGEMLMFYKPNRLIALNLETRRVRKIGINLVYYDYHKNVIATTYRSSLVGLNRLAHT